MSVPPSNLREWAERHHEERMPFLIEVQFGGENAQCLVVDRAAKRSTANQAAADYREMLGADPDFLGCFVRMEAEGGEI